MSAKDAAFNTTGIWMPRTKRIQREKERNKTVVNARAWRRCVRARSFYSLDDRNNTRRRETLTREIRQPTRRWWRKFRRMIKNKTRSRDDHYVFRTPVRLWNMLLLFFKVFFSTQTLKSQNNIYTLYLFHVKFTGGNYRSKSIIFSQE